MNILVTGATGGIGKAIADELRSVGKVFVTGRNLGALKEYENYCQCDFCKDIEVLEKYIEENEIDVLINNAGEYIYGTIDKMTDEKISNLFEINTLAPIKLIRSASNVMKNKKWGRIINIGSISGVMGESSASIYSSTKAALIGLTKALALELAEYNITVNTINPGWVDTTLGHNSIEQSDFTKEEIINCIPQRRFVTPEEVAGLVKYLISEEAKGVTGQSVNVCAGLSVGI